MAKSLAEAAKNLLTTIREMQHGKQAWFGPFSEWGEEHVNAGTVYDVHAANIEWPNLQICADEVETALKELQALVDSTLPTCGAHSNRDALPTLICILRVGHDGPHVFGEP